MGISRDVELVVKQHNFIEPSVISMDVFTTTVRQHALFNHLHLSSEDEERKGSFCDKCDGMEELSNRDVHCDFLEEGAYLPRKLSSQGSDGFPPNSITTTASPLSSPADIGIIVSLFTIVHKEMLSVLRPQEVTAPPGNESPKLPTLSKSSARLQLKKSVSRARRHSRFRTPKWRHTSPRAGPLPTSMSSTRTLLCSRAKSPRVGGNCSSSPLRIDESWFTDTPSKVYDTFASEESSPTRSLSGAEEPGSESSHEAAFTPSNRDYLTPSSSGFTDAANEGICIRSAPTTLYRWHVDTSNTNWPEALPIEIHSDWTSYSGFFANSPSQKRIDDPTIEDCEEVEYLTPEPPRRTVRKLRIVGIKSSRRTRLGNPTQPRTSVSEFKGLA